MPTGQSQWRSKNNAFFEKQRPIQPEAQEAIRKLEDEGLFFEIAEEPEAAVEGGVKSSGTVAGAA